STCLATALATAAPTRPSQARKPAGPQPEAPVKPGFRVLLAEDDRVNQRVALAQLNKLGYPTDVAANGFEVLAALEKARYDIVLIDCHMPGLNGFRTSHGSSERKKCE